MSNLTKLSTLYIGFHLSLTPILAAASADKCQIALIGNQHQKALYRPKVCCDSIYFLLEKLKFENPSFDLKSSHVLFIYSRWSGAMPYLHGLNYFVPLRTRHDTAPRWGFHVVLSHLNNIYDFDYAKELIAIPAPEYFAKTFQVRWIQREGQSTYNELNEQYFLDDDIEIPTKSSLKLHIRIIPADTYLNEYAPHQRGKALPDKKPFMYWLTTTERYPDQTLQSYLESLSVSPFNLPNQTTGIKEKDLN